MGVGRIIFIISSFTLLLYAKIQGAYKLWFKTLPQYLLRIIEIYNTYKWLVCSCAEVVVFLPTVGAMIVSIAQVVWAIKELWDMIKTDKHIDKDCLILSLQLHNEQLVDKLRKIGEEYKLDMTDVLTENVKISSRTTATTNKEVMLEKPVITVVPTLPRGVENIKAAKEKTT